MTNLRILHATRIAAYAAWLACAALVMVACSAESEPEPPPLVDPFVVSVSAEAELAALQMHLAYDTSAVRVERIDVSTTDVFSAAYESGSGGLTLALASQTALRGRIVDITFSELEAGGRDTVQFDSLEAYDATEQPAAVTTAIEPLTSEASPATTPGTCPETAGNASVPQGLKLEATFADYRLGNVNADADIDVLDVLRVLGIATGGVASPSAFAYYHADVDLDDSVGHTDVCAILAKAVDPTLPARLHVVPRRVTFAYARDGGPILANNVGNEPLPGFTWNATGGASLEQVAGVAGHAAAFEVDLPAVWTDAHAELATVDDTFVVPLGNLAILIAGQSNAAGYGLPLDPPAEGSDEVRMLGNDYEWKKAYEPLDDETGQVDAVSREDPYDPAHSFGVRLGTLLHDASDDRFGGHGRRVYLIPAAKQGTEVSGTDQMSWQPYSSPTDRSTLIGSATYRALVSAGRVPGAPYEAKGGPVSAIVWYQGESDVDEAERDAFIANTNDVMDAFAAELGDPHVIYVQLASLREPSVNNVWFQSIRERQRMMEAGVPHVNTGTGLPAPRPRFHMVVAHDLPRSDSVHLSAEGQRMLAERIALAFREHVLGEAVDGTGPRLEGITRSGRTITIDTTRTINDHSSYEGYFSVWLKSAPTTDQVPIASIRRDPSDPTAVRITLSEDPPGDVLVRYMPPPFGNQDVQLHDVVKDPSTGLPLPAFGNNLNLE